MFFSRTDRISSLIHLHQQLDPSNTNCLLEDPSPIITDIQTIRDFLKTEIESFAINIINGLLELKGTIDIEFAEKVIEFNQNFFGEVLADAVSKFYLQIGFDSFLKIISQIKNLSSAIYGFEALFNKIIMDGEKHRTEACELTTKLEEIISSEDFNRLSSDQTLRVTNMIERLKPHARPIIRKMFYYKDMPLRKGEENGVSSPIFSRSGNWHEHHLIMEAIGHSFEESQNKLKKVLKK